MVVLLVSLAIANTFLIKSAEAKLIEIPEEQFVLIMGVVGGQTDLTPQIHEKFWTAIKQINDKSAVLVDDIETLIKENFVYTYSRWSLERLRSIQFTAETGKIQMSPDYEVWEKRLLQSINNPEIMSAVKTQFKQARQSVINFNQGHPLLDMVDGSSSTKAIRDKITAQYQRTLQILEDFAEPDWTKTSAAKSQNISTSSAADVLKTHDGFKYPAAHIGIRSSAAFDINSAIQRTGKLTYDVTVITQPIPDAMQVIFWRVFKGNPVLPDSILERLASSIILSRQGEVLNHSKELWRSLKSAVISGRIPKGRNTYTYVAARTVTREQPRGYLTFSVLVGGSIAEAETRLVELEQRIQLQK